MMEEQTENILIEEEKTIYEIDSECVKKHLQEELKAESAQQIKRKI